MNHIRDIRKWKVAQLEAEFDIELGALIQKHVQLHELRASCIALAEGLGRSFSITASVPLTDLLADKRHAALYEAVRDYCAKPDADALNQTMLRIAWWLEKRPIVLSTAADLGRAFPGTHMTINCRQRDLRFSMWMNNAPTK